MKKFIDLIPFILVFLLISVLAFSVLYFTGIINFQEKTDYNLVFNCDDFTMEVGSNITLEAYLEPNNGSEIKWESSDTDVLVIEDGLVTSKKEGAAIITVTSVENNKSDTCTVTVKNEIINVSSIELDKTEISLTEEDTYKLNATIKPQNASNKNIVWETSDNKVAIVNDGKITAKGKGTTIITAKSSDGTKTATCIVNVAEKEKNIPVSGIKLDKEKLELYIGDAFGINVIIEPNDATNKTVTWTSSNTKIVQVSDGKITAKGKGTAIVTATTSNGKTAKITITVKEKPKETIEVTGISLTPNKLTLKENEEYNLNATITPSNATNKTVTWKSSNTNVATINNGKVIAKGKGTTTITATTSNGKTASIEVVVKENETNPEQPTTIPVTNISLNKTALTLYVGNSETLVATIIPSNATNKTVIWKSSNTNVVTVVNGLLTAKGVGTATITATTSNGKTATSEVTVKSQTIPVSSITLNKTSGSIYLNSSNKTITLNATILPANATNKTITWKSSNTNVATVENGVVTAKEMGTATITATAGDKTATYTINVKKKIILVVGASQVGVMNRAMHTYVSPSGNNYSKTDQTLKYFFKSGSGIPYQYNGGEGWTNMVGFIDNYKSVKKYVELYIFFPLPGNEIMTFNCNQITASNEEIQSFAKGYNDSIQSLKNQNYDVKAYVVSMHPVRVTEADSDKVVSNQNKNSCIKGYRSNIKYLTFNRTIKAIILNKYQNNLKFESLFVKIMNINEEGKNFTYKWEYYHTTDGIHWDEKTAQLYVKEMLDYYNEL